MLIGEVESYNKIIKEMNPAQHKQLFLTKKVKEALTLNLQNRNFEYIFHLQSIVSQKRSITEKKELKSIRRLIRFDLQLYGNHTWIIEKIIREIGFKVSDNLSFYGKNIYKNWILRK